MQRVEALFFAWIMRPVFPFAAALGLVLTGCAPAPAPPGATQPAPPAQAAPTVQRAQTPAPASPASPASQPARSSPPTPAPTTAPSRASGPRYGGTLAVASFGDPVHLDVQQATSWSVLGLLRLVYNGVVEWDPQTYSKVIPELAERWESNTEGTVYTFHIRKGVRWHDGQPLTAEDVAFSVNRMARPPKGTVSERGQELLSAVEKAEAVDSSTVTVKLTYPQASFLYNFAMDWIVVMPKHVIQAKGDMKATVVGSGPFRFKKYTSGVSLEVVKSPDYFVKGRPYLDGVTFYILPDVNTRFAAMRTGQIKMSSISQSITTQQRLTVERDPELSKKIIVKQHAVFSPNNIYFNLTRRPFNDVRVRRAVHLALDRQAGVKVNQGEGTIGAHLHPQGLWGIPLDETLRLPGFREPKVPDLAEAKKLLTEAGYGNGLKTTLIFDRQNNVLAQAMKDQLAKAGIDATLQPEEANVAIRTLSRQEFDIEYFAVVYPVDDPEVIFNGGFVTNGPRNFGKYSNKEFDKLNDQQKVLQDVTKRKVVVRQMQDILLEDMPAIPYFWRVWYRAWWTDVKDFVQGPGAFMGNKMDHVWLAP